MTVHYLVMRLDPEGLPRAWGKAPTVEAARKEAARQLDAYVAKRRALGESWHVVADFTEEVSAVDPAPVDSPHHAKEGGEP